MKNYLLSSAFLSIFLILNFGLHAQMPQQIWRKTIGGTDIEAHGTQNVISKFFGRWVSIDIDGNSNIYLATSSKSNNVYVSENNGEEDIFVVCMNFNGDTLWTKVFGGSSSERVLRVRALSGGGCIVVGHSYSQNGFFHINNETGSNGYLIRLDAQGNIVWFKMYGGSNFDYLYDIIETSDGFLMACGEAHSDDGDLAGTNEGRNWVMKINPDNGNIIWSKTFLGADAASPDRFENLFRLVQTTSNSVVLTGYTTPDFLNFNIERINIIQIDLDGNLNWTKKIGAAGSGDYPAAIVSDQDGAFYILAHLQAQIGGNDDASNYFGEGDFWLVKLNNSGTILWEKNYGGTSKDVPYDMKRDTNGNLYLLGTSSSTNHDANAPAYGMQDFWLCKVTNQGDTIYTMRFGGSENDFGSGIALSQNGNSMFITGGTESNNGTISGLVGMRDIWITRVDYFPGLFVSDISYIDIELYPNPVQDYFYVKGEQLSGVKHIYITDMTGSVVKGVALKTYDKVDMSNLPNGQYLVLFISHQNTIVQKKIVTKQ